MVSHIEVYVKCSRSGKLYIHILIFTLKSPGFEFELRRIKDANVSDNRCDQAVYRLIQSFTRTNLLTTEACEEITGIFFVMGRGGCKQGLLRTSGHLILISVRTARFHSYATRKGLIESNLGTSSAFSCPMPDATCLVSLSAEESNSLF